MSGTGIGYCDNTGMYASVLIQPQSFSCEVSSCRSEFYRLSKKLACVRIFPLIELKAFNRSTDQRFFCVVG